MRRDSYGKLTMLDRSGTNNHTGNVRKIGHQCTNHRTHYTKYGKIYHRLNDCDGGTNTSTTTQKFQNHQDTLHRINVNNEDQIPYQLATLKLEAHLVHNHQEADQTNPHQQRQQYTKVKPNVLQWDHKDSTVRINLMWKKYQTSTMISQQIAQTAIPTITWQHHAYQTQKTTTWWITNLGNNEWITHYQDGHNGKLTSSNTVRQNMKPSHKTSSTHQLHSHLTRIHHQRHTILRYLDQIQILNTKHHVQRPSVYTGEGYERRSR